MYWKEGNVNYTIIMTSSFSKKKKHYQHLNEDKFIFDCREKWSNASMDNLISTVGWQSRSIFFVFGFYITEQFIIRKRNRIVLFVCISWIIVFFDLLLNDVEMLLIYFSKWKQRTTRSIRTENSFKYIYKCSCHL